MTGRKSKADKSENYAEVCERMKLPMFAKGAKVRLNPRLLDFGKCTEEHLRIVLTISTVQRATSGIIGEPIKYYYGIEEFNGDLYPSHWLVPDGI